jgi:hypothetical protein
MAKSGIKSSYVRASEAMGQYKSSMYNAVTQEKIGEMQKEETTQEANAIQRGLEFGGEIITYLEARNQEKKDMRLIEKGVAVAEANTKVRVNYDKVTLADILNKDGKLTDLGRETWRFGNKTFDAAQMIALAKTHDQNEMKFLTGEDVPEPASLANSSGWTFKSGETSALSGTSSMGYKLGAAMDEESAYLAANSIYDLGGSKSSQSHGIYQWSARGAIVDSLFTAEGERSGLTNEDYKNFTRLKGIVNNDISTEEEKKKANTKLKPFYAKVTENNSWKQIAPHVRTAESSDEPYTINRNESGRGFDIGPYQINTRWIMEGDNSYQIGGDGVSLYEAWSQVDKDLKSGLAGYEAPETPLPYFGKKEGFDMGDIFGDNSMRNKDDSLDNMNPFGDPRYQKLLDYGIIDKNWNVFDTNLGGG